ncbi:hypothetical protein [Rhodobacter sp. NSM]|uniref:hypothetical protein n=1 Tax=Rhodobacter sp. NSM TaxID=3457501 RepID=UPI003FD27C72
MTLRTAWLRLLVLTAASATFAELAARGVAGPAGFAAGGIAVLGLSWFKARTILASYLRLDETPEARRIFAMVLALYLLLLGALFLAPLA